MNRREVRKNAVQCLYQMDVSKIPSSEALENLELETKDTYLISLVKGIEEKITEIDEQIRPYLKGWTIERLSVVDRSILRLAVFEMKYSNDVPPAVVINEAVELTKIFGDTDSRKFINGILSTMMKEETNHQ